MAGLEDGASPAAEQGAGARPLHQPCRDPHIGRCPRSNRSPRAPGTRSWETPRSNPRCGGAQHRWTSPREVLQGTAGGEGRTEGPPMGLAGVSRPTPAFVTGTDSPLAACAQWQGLHTTAPAQPAPRKGQGDEGRATAGTGQRSEEMNWAPHYRGRQTPSGCAHRTFPTPSGNWSDPERRSETPQLGAQGHRHGLGNPCHPGHRRGQIPVLHGEVKTPPAATWKPTPFWPAPRNPAAWGCLTPSTSDPHHGAC